MARKDKRAMAVERSMREIGRKCGEKLEREISYVCCNRYSVLVHPTYIDIYYAFFHFLNSFYIL